MDFQKYVFTLAEYFFKSLMCMCGVEIKERKKKPEKGSLAVFNFFSSAGVKTALNGFKKSSRLEKSGLKIGVPLCLLMLIVVSPTT